MVGTPNKVRLFYKNIDIKITFILHAFKYMSAHHLWWLSFYRRSFGPTFKYKNCLVGETDAKLDCFGATVLDLL